MVYNILKYLLGENMLKSIEYFSYLLGVEPFWTILIILLLILLGLIKSFYPWMPKWKSKETIEKDGKVTKYYHLDE